MIALADDANIGHMALYVNWPYDHELLQPAFVCGHEVTGRYPVWLHGVLLSGTFTLSSKYERFSLTGQERLRYLIVTQ